MSWRTHPFRHRRLRGLFGLVVVLACLGLVQAWAHSPPLTLLGGILFLLTLWPFYFPVRYRLTDVGIEVDYGLWRRSWRWDRFQVYVPLKGAVLLSPFRQSHPLERYRGLQLPCAGHEMEVQSVLASHLDPRPGQEGLP